MPVDNFWVFALTALLLNLTPGNDMLYVIARSSSQGTKAGVISSLGIMAGCMVHIIAAVLGLSALIARSAVAFDIIKYVGAAYLIYLGIQSIMSKKRSLQLKTDTTHLSYKRLFWQGAFTNVLNPKVALFFLAFLPQFIDINGSVSPSLQILFLGTWFNVGGTLVNILVALLFGKVGEWINRSARLVQWQERITGVILISLGIKVALSARK
jgi:threonine/homoserine/homoserine lactone efflux protein